MTSITKYTVIIAVFIFLFTACAKCPFICHNESAGGLTSILKENAVMEKVTPGITFDTAGSPLWTESGFFFTNNNFDPADKSKTYFMDNSGNSKIIRENNGVTTSLKLTGKGTFYCCEMIGHRVVEMNAGGKALRVVAGEYNGKRLDGPNDLVVDKKGGFYFTDSKFSPGQELVQDKPAVYYVNPAGKISRVIDDVEFPNGIGLSPDGKILYIANTRGPLTKGRFLLAYDILPDCSVKNGRNFAELQLTDEDNNKPDGFGGADGLAVDSAGNVYAATTKGLGIQVFNKNGAHLGNISCPAITNNMCFGGEDLKTLYISAKDSIYKIDLKNSGIKWQIK